MQNNTKMNNKYLKMVYHQKYIVYIQVNERTVLETIWATSRICFSL